MDYTILVIIIPIIIIIFSFVYLIKYKKINLYKLFSENDKTHIDIKTKIIVVLIWGSFAMVCGGLAGILNIKKSYCNIIWGLIFTILVYLGGTVLTKK